MWMQAVGVGRPVAPRWRLRPLMPERGDNHRKVFPSVLNPDPGQGPGISPSRRITARAWRRHPIRWIVSSLKHPEDAPACEVPRLPPRARQRIRSGVRSSLIVCVWMLKILQRGLPCPHQRHLRRIGLSSGGAGIRDSPDCPSHAFLIL